MSGMHIIVIGNPVDGVSFVGPFTTGEDAIRHAEEHAAELDWWIAPLHEAVTA